MNVRAKFRCTQIIKTCYAGNDAPVDMVQVKLSAVYGETNKTWSKWTPSGELTMTINNPAALEQYHVGEFYFLDFTDAPAKEADEK